MHEKLEKHRPKDEVEGGESVKKRKKIELGLGHHQYKAPLTTIDKLQRELLSNIGLLQLPHLLHHRKKSSVFYSFLLATITVKTMGMY